jgi:hypothetical protein
MGNRKIKIKGTKHGHELDLSNNGNAEVESNTDYRKIVWTLRTEKVESFRIEGKSPGNPFEKPIPVDFRPRVALKVNRYEPEKDWEYVIYWKAPNDPIIHCHDPKIAIRSSKDLPGHRLNLSWKTWVGLGFGLLGIALLLTDNKKKNR